MNFNRVILAGYLTRDPKLSYTPAQKPVVDFGMAINRNWKGEDGQKREEVCFVDCRAFGKTAETINQYLSKGKPILLEGRLYFSSWEKEGVGHNKLSVTVDQFQFMPDEERQQAAPPQAAPPQSPPKPAAPPQQDEPYTEYGSPEDNGDIPF